MKNYDLKITYKTASTPEQVHEVLTRLNETELSTEEIVAEVKQLGITRARFQEIAAYAGIDNKERMSAIRTRKLERARMDTYITRHAEIMEDLTAFASLEFLKKKYDWTRKFVEFVILDCGYDYEDYIYNGRVAVNNKRKCTKKGDGVYQNAVIAESLSGDGVSLKHLSKPWMFGANTNKPCRTIYDCR